MVCLRIQEPFFIVCGIVGNCIGRGPNTMLTHDDALYGLAVQ